MNVSRSLLWGFTSEPEDLDLKRWRQPESGLRPKAIKDGPHSRNQTLRLRAEENARDSDERQPEPHRSETCGSFVDQQGIRLNLERKRERFSLSSVQIRAVRHFARHRHSRRGFHPFGQRQSAETRMSLRQLEEFPVNRWRNLNFTKQGRQ
jgi:hypothetical protein